MELEKVLFKKMNSFLNFFSFIIYRNKTIVEDLDYAITILFQFAERHLKDYGYLVFWQPVILKNE